MNKEAFSNNVPPFSQRVLGLGDRIAAAPDAGFPRGSSTASLAVPDQLLVHEDHFDAVRNYLASREVEVNALGTVFQDMDRVTEDVVIAELSNLPSDQNIDVLTDDIRTEVSSLREVNPGRVSPNHVLVPAGNGVGCPSGPPGEGQDVSLAEPPPGPSPTVTVIDSGYQWDDPAWGANPLAGLCQLVAVKPAEYVQGTPTLAALKAILPAATAGWNQGVPEPPAQNNTMLHALAGHANFVGGVIAQGCHRPTLNIWTHNSSFVANRDFFPTEAAVCRSIVKSQLPDSEGGTGPTDVIYVGFAFPLRRKVPRRKGVSRELAQDFLSEVWELTFQRLTHNPLVVAPAGNEATTNRHYPAALDTVFPNTGYQNVIGVASLNTKRHKLSTFSNRGDWVRCSAVGEGVVSTFLAVKNVTCEEDPPNAAGVRPAKDFSDGWATWNGTSFAAPKVAAALAARTAAGATPIAAWNALVTVLGNPVSQPGAGTRFQNL